MALVLRAAPRWYALQFFARVPRPNILDARVRLPLAIGTRRGWLP